MTRPFFAGSLSALIYAILIAIFASLGSGNDLWLIAAGMLAVSAVMCVISIGRGECDVFLFPTIE